MVKFGDRVYVQLLGEDFFDCLKNVSKVNVVENKFNLIGEMCMQVSGIFGVGCIWDIRQLYIFWMIEYNVWCGICN